MIEVAVFLDLPRFPDITEDCYLHPNMLCMKYLLEVNLPGELCCAGEEAWLLSYVKQNSRAFLSAADCSGHLKESSVPGT